MTAGTPQFDVIRDTTRLAWLVNFEAVATAGNDDDAQPEGHLPG